MTLKVENCNEKQQKEAEEFLLKTSNVKEKPDTLTKSKASESIGFTVTNSKGKTIDSIESGNIKVIQGITNYKEKSKESYTFKDKKIQ